MIELESATLHLRLLPLGAAIAGLHAPDRSGTMGPVHLELGDAAAYTDRSVNPHLGASIGRYANRIAGAAFELDGQVHELVANNGANTLHGGPDGWDRREWDVTEVHRTEQGGRVVFGLLSPDGDGGFPGTATASAAYELDGELLRITYSATSDAPTVINMTNHGYWHLDDEATIAEHHVQLFADRVLPVDGAGIPTGDLVEVVGTEFDLRRRTLLGSAIEARGSGFDHCFEVVGDPGAVRPVAVLDAPSSGRWMTVASDRPGVQLYTGNGLGAPFGPFGAVSLETQDFPDAPNRPGLGSVRLDPGQEYRNVTELRFGVGPPPQPIGR